MVNTHRGTKAYLLIYAELITAARYRGTVTYQELAELVGLPLHGIYMGSTWALNSASTLARSSKTR